MKNSAQDLFTEENVLWTQKVTRVLPYTLHGRGVRGLRLKEQLCLSRIRKTEGREGKGMGKDSGLYGIQAEEQLGCRESWRPGELSD